MVQITDPPRVLGVGTEGGHTLFELYDVTGAKVFAYETANGNNKINLPLEIANGVYFYSIKNNGIIKEQNKLIVVR